MDITKLLHKLAIIPDVEIVIALLPEMLGKVPTQANSGLEWGTRDQAALGKVPTQGNSGLEWGTCDQSARHALLQRLESIGEHSALGFADQQVNMLGHDHIPVDAKPETASHTL